jgi:AcrR family transcriptional regulator
MVKAVTAQITSQAKLERLDTSAWIAAALEALAEGGIDSVRVEPLAKRLKVTKGSFYWHFADRRALLDAMLAYWSEGRMAAIRDQAAAGATGGESPTVVLLRLADRYTRHGNTRGLAIELAIRAFARADQSAAGAVQAVDGERLAHVATLFGRLGWPERDAKARAVLFYSYLFGQSLLASGIVTPDSIDIAIETLLAPPD